MKNNSQETSKNLIIFPQTTIKTNSYTAEFMYKSFRSLFSSLLVFSRSKNACSNIFLTKS